LSLPGLDAEQSKQLLQFLTNLQANKQASQEPCVSQGSSTAHMAGITLSTSHYIASTATICCTCKLEDSIWIVDSGASDHMIFDKSLLHNMKHLANPILITLPNGNKIKVTQFGDLRIGKHLVLHHVLFVPYFQFNLLSVKQLSQQLKCEVVFSENSCVL